MVIIIGSVYGNNTKYVDDFCCQKVSKMSHLLTSCFFKSPKYGVIFIHGPLWAHIRDSRGMVFSRSLTFDVKPFYLSAHDCPVIAKWSVNKCNGGD